MLLHYHNMNIIKHDDYDIVIFTGTREQCVECLQAMMKVSRNVEYESDGFWCDRPDGSRIRYSLSIVTPVVYKWEKLKPGWRGV